MAGIASWTVFLAWGALASGTFEPSYGYSHLPWLAQVGLTVVLIILWQAFAFFAAVLLEEAERRGRELAVRNGELLATQTMLSESAKVGERLRIARDLHDSAGHLLTALSVNLQLASRLVEGPGAEQVRRAHVVARTLLGEVRETVGTMREEAVIDLEKAVRQLTAAVVRPAVHVEIAEGLAMADPARAHALFRCVQEILTNTMRHGEAKNLWLRVGRGDGTVKVEARDDGRGCGTLKEGNGLRGMRERLEECGGWLLVETSEGAGFSYRLELPL
ncbi:MAG: sensor histidine kinase [Acidobacteria bacterium]|nr:sensor histidine kinase [Acidobacteriota bacterium]